MLKICFGLCTQVSGRIFSLIKDEQFSLWFYCLLPSDRFSIWCIQGSTSGSVCLSLCKYIYIYTYMSYAFHPSVTQKLPGGLCVQQFCRRSRESNPQSFLHIRSFTASSQALGKKRKKRKYRCFFLLLLLNVVRVVDLKHVTHKCVVSLIPGDFFFPLLLLSAVHLFTPSAAGECSISNGWKYPLKVAR